MRMSIVASLAPCFAKESAEEQDPDTNPQTGGTISKNPDTRREEVKPKSED